MSFFVLIRVMFMFVITAAFKKGELSVNKSTFNPMKLLMFIIIVLYFVISFPIISKTMATFAKVEKNCPGLMKRVGTYKEGDDNVFTCIIEKK